MFRNVPPPRGSRISMLILCALPFLALIPDRAHADGPFPLTFSIGDGSEFPPGYWYRCNTASTCVSCAPSPGPLVLPLTIDVYVGCPVNVVDVWSLPGSDARVNFVERPLASGVTCPQFPCSGNFDGAVFYANKGAYVEPSGTPSAVE